MKHKWGPSRLNHGEAQCERCMDEDAKAAAKKLIVDAVEQVAQSIETFVAESERMLKRLEDEAKSGGRGEG